MPWVILDLDGVLADFDGGVCALFGADPPVHEHAGAAINEAIGVSRAQMWARIDRAGRRFWEDLVPTPFADELDQLARSYGSLFVATSPSLSPSSAAGKIRWIQKRYGRNFRDFAIIPRKDLLAAADRVLVDDTERHVSAFREAGGKAILVPTRGNGRLEQGADPMAAVRKALDSL
jgi:FMN phosphatase YigB (HAD superfamily)